MGFILMKYNGIENNRKDFFDEDPHSPSKARDLFEIAKTLNVKQLDNLIGLAKG